MTNAANNILKNSSATKRNYWPAILVFTLPWLADIIILSGQNSGLSGAEGRQIFDAPIGLMLNGIYAAAPFALMAAAMRPRLKVSRALWGGAVLTACLWLAYGFAGAAAQSAEKISEDEFVTPQSGELFLIVFVIIMIWPCVIAILMGIAAKFKEAPLSDAPLNETGM